MKTVVFIDGENFKKALRAVLISEGKKKENIDFLHIDYNFLIKNVLGRKKINEIRYYGAKLRMYKETKKKSLKLIQDQRNLINYLKKQGINFIKSGNVRMHKKVINGKTVYLFSEKGVDVRLAVDMISMACKDKIKTAIICSSDSDLQPAVSELKRRGIETIYLGFDKKPNKGLIYTTDKAILFRSEEILDAMK